MNLFKQNSRKDYSYLVFALLLTVGHLSLTELQLKKGINDSCQNSMLGQPVVIDNREEPETPLQKGHLK